MPKYDEFDLDLQSVEIVNEGDISPKVYPPTQDPTVIYCCL